MDQHNSPAKQSESAVAASPKGVSRRALLSGAKAAVPAIVTLYSGAALARSSNLISTSYSQRTVDGKFQCLDTQGLEAVGTSKYDLGSPPLAHVTRINRYSTYYKPNWSGGPSSQEISQPDMCRYGGDFYRRDWGRFTKVTVKRGGMVSGTALGSFSNVTTFTDV